MQYTVAAAAKAAGISPWRLRTWERRYGIPEPGRSASGRRVYTEEDLRVIKRMAALVEQGIPASQAVEVVRSERASGIPAALEERPADPRVESLIDATRSLDEQAVVDLIREAADELGWLDALEHVVLPALRAIGDLWQRGDVPVMQEHFFSQLVRLELMHAVAAQPRAAEDSPVLLLAGAEDERHEIGQLALWLLLRERGVRVLALGPDVPAAELVAAARQAAPAVICLSGVIAPAASMLAAAARALVEARTGARVFVGGPAVAEPSDSDSIAATTLPQALGATVERLLSELDR